jgi:hypothetical protein
MAGFVGSRTRTAGRDAVVGVIAVMLLNMSCGADSH